jgi:Flp pilus assembly protein TadG
MDHLHTRRSVQGWNTLFRTKQGTVAVMTALCLPPLTLAVGLGIEASGWVVTQQGSLQRTADLAALAAAQAYGRGATTQLAATQAAYLAEINGAAGASAASARVWNAAASAPTLSDNSVTIQVIKGVVNPADTAFAVKVQQNVPLLLAALPLNRPSITLAATAIAEIVPSGPQPCLVTLGGDINGVTSGTDATFSGNVDITANNCSIRSDAGVSVSGNVAINASSIYASGTITASGNVTVNAAEYTQQAQLADPYANWSPLQTALANAACTGGATFNTSSGSQTLSPGCYSGINDSNAALTLSPGVYYVNGGINLSGNASLSGNGVTIVSTGTFSSSGNVLISLIAPTGGATAGIAYASSNAQGSSFSGNEAMSFTGLIYYPNGILSVSGNAANGSTGCAEIVAQTVNFSGNANLASNCGAYGLPTYGSTTAPALVE